MSAALIPFKQVNRGGAKTRPGCGSTFLPQSPRRVSTERVDVDVEAGPDRTDLCDAFRVQQQRERSAASVMTRPGKRSFQAALVVLSVAQLATGKRATEGSPRIKLRFYNTSFS